LKWQRRIDDADKAPSEWRHPNPLEIVTCPDPIPGINRRGKPVTVEGEGLLARALQHEVDHLDGILFIARIQDSARLWRVSERG
jgi:hypothetical protein